MEATLKPKALTKIGDALDEPVQTILQRRIAVLIPCYNEEFTIESVIGGFRRELPSAEIYVFDNSSTDRTSERERAAGAIVRRERRQGKRYVVQSMFQQVDADIYVMVDGDATYPATAVHALIEPVLRQDAEMAVGSRLHCNSRSEFKKLNRFGNYFFLAVLNSMFHVELTDILSGYRAFSREFVKNIPLFAGGFQVEAELTIKTLERGYRIQETPVDLNPRPGMCLFAVIAGLAFGIPVISEFLRTGLAPRLPSAVLAVGLVISGMLVIAVGLILHTTARRFQELEYQMGTVNKSVSQNAGKTEIGIWFSTRRRD